MELKDFVSEAIEQISQGIKDAGNVCAKDGVKINPECRSVAEGIVGVKSEGNAIMLKFHLGLCENSDSQNKKGIGVFLGNIGVGTNLTDKNENKVVSTLDFSIPVVFPRPCK